jgi:hypothetical protein
MLPLCYLLPNEIATDSLILGLECNFPGWIADPSFDTSRLSFFTTRLKFTDRLTASDCFWLIAARGPMAAFPKRTADVF